MMTYRIIDVRPDDLSAATAALQQLALALLEELFANDASRMRIIVTFLALLELIKDRAVAAEQGEQYGEIQLMLLRDVEADYVLTIEVPEEADG